MTNTVTTAHIEGLLQAAALAGDREMVAVCRRAITGDTAAHTECATVILDARRECEHARKRWAEEKGN